MFVKRYIAKDMKEAKMKIRNELGEDAVILNSRYIRKKGLLNFFKKKLLEVMVAYDPKEKNSLKTVSVSTNSDKLFNNNDQEFKKIEKLNEQIEELQDVVKNFTDKIKTTDNEMSIQLSGKIISIYDKMKDNDIDEMLAKEIASDAQNIMANMDVNADQVIRQLLIEKIGEPSPIKLKKYRRNIFVIFGPTGVGKTTTLVKLAANFSLEQGLKVGIINTDTFRVAAQEQLNIYSAIMGVVCDIAYNANELNTALKKQQDRDVILIDTSGCSSANNAFKDEIENILGACNVDEKFLTLSTTTSYKACKDIINGVSFIDNYKIILTKLDEVNRWGNIVNIIEYAKKPLAYITNGQNVPNDIDEAHPEKIVERILEIGDNND